LALEDPQNAEGMRISWHPAFVEALKQELEAYKDVLEYAIEYQLNAEPLKIDVVIIKKAKNIVMNKNIAAIFREYNLLEFKSPGDYVSVGDFYKVYGYACLYASLNKVPISGLSATFVESRQPRELLAHLKEIRGYRIEKRGPGIYTVAGDIIPIQIINSRELPEGENIWLKSLDNKLGLQGLNRVTAEIDRLGKAAQIKAYLDVIVRANPEALKEALKMSDAALTLERVFEEAGLTAKWEAQGRAEGEARGKAEGKAEVARNLIRLGLPLEKVAQATELDLETIKSLTQG
jgi:hypothetical protein